VTTPVAGDGRVGDLGTILGVWAHPDDEVYLSGGIMAAARDAGQRVVCVTATRGEQGGSGALALPPAQLGAVRARELRRSLAILGVHEHHQLGIEDGRCADGSDAVVVERIATIIEAVRPTTILTFGPDGMTGHEDHQVVCRWATAARAAAAPDARLLYATSTAEHAEAWADLHAELEVFLVPGLPERRTPDEVALELRLDEDLSARKDAALRAQTSQTADLIELIGSQRYRDWCSSEAFVAAETVEPREWPTWRPPLPT
jgi:LmbE family N-acetylglucosaminyl deacetylase